MRPSVLEYPAQFNFNRFCFCFKRVTLFPALHQGLSPLKSGGRENNDIQREIGKLLEIKVLVRILLAILKDS